MKDGREIRDATSQLGQQLRTQEEKKCSQQARFGQDLSAILPKGVELEKGWSE